MLTQNLISCFKEFIEKSFEWILATNQFNNDPKVMDCIYNTLFIINRLTEIKDENVFKNAIDIWSIVARLMKAKL
jgi:hypothetical protein